MSQDRPYPDIYNSLPAYTQELLEEVSKGIAEQIAAEKEQLVKDTISHLAEKLIPYNICDKDGVGVFFYLDEPGDLKKSIEAALLEILKEDPSIDE